MLDREKEREYREEARRLAELPRADQREIIALHRSVADDGKVSKRDRELARERAEALARFLRLEKPSRKPGNARRAGKPSKRPARPGGKR